MSVAPTCIRGGSGIAASMESITRGRSRRRGESGGSSERNAAHSRAPTVDHHESVPLRKQATYPGILSDPLFALGKGQSKSRKASAVPMKMLIDEEFSKDAKARHISPGAVGRLMGLDSLPASGTHNQNKYTLSHAPKTSPGSSHDRCCLYGDIPHRRSADDIKDVFEVMGTTKVKMHRCQRSGNGNTSSRYDKIDSADIDFIRQKFMDAKRLSTDESLHMSEEFNETLEALVSNRDLLLEFLQKFDPVVRRDLHNHGSPPSTANCITILKPAQRNQFTGTDNIDPQVKGTESYFSMQKEAKHSLGKPYSNVASLSSLKEESGSWRQKLSRSSHQENTDKRPTRIVVLKPSIEKAHHIEGAFALNHKIPHSDYRRHKECQSARRCSPYTEECMCQVSLGDSETLGHMGKGSREIAREITKQMRAARGGCCERDVKPDDKISVSDKRSQFLSSVTKIKTSEAFHRSPDLCDAWAYSNSSPTYSSGTSVSKEAKKHLSNRWKKTHQFRHQIIDNDGFSTLGDMLALSDQDAPKVTGRKMAHRKCPKAELRRDRMPGSCIYPLGISSNDGWRDVVTSNLTRSKSLPSSFIRGVQKSNNRKRNGSGRHYEFSMLKDVLKVAPNNSQYVCGSRRRQSLSRESTFHDDESDLMSSDNKESMVIEREIHVNYEEPANGIAMQDTSEQSLHPANLDHELDAVGCLDTSSAVPDREPLSPVGQNQQMLNPPATASDDRLLGPNFNDFVTEDEQIEYLQADDYPAVYNPQIESELRVGTDHHQGGDNHTLCIPPNGSESPRSSNKDDQESPVSVLESSMDAEDIYSGDFEKISADLQELRMQLRLLKRETTDSGDSKELFILSDDDEMACQSPPEMEKSHAFKDEEERDFSYVLDILTDLGIDAANEDELLNNCYLLECPAVSDLFDKLEKKYSSLILWPQPERKLLFDITKAVLADIITSLMQCSSKGLFRRSSPGWNREGFVEMVWQRVVQLRQEMEFNQEDQFMDVEWLGSEDGIYLIGSDIGSILQDDLLKEIVADFMRLTKSTKLSG